MTNVFLLFILYALSAASILAGIAMAMIVLGTIRLAVEALKKVGNDG